MRGWVLCPMFFVAAAPVAQGLVSPARYAGVEGEGAATSFGHRPSYRHMLFDGEAGAVVRTLKGLRLRRDFGNGATSADRTWNSVTLHVATCDLDRLSPTFSANVTSTPVRVFSGRVWWPALTALPKTAPDVFGGSLAHYVFPFTSSVAHDGKADVCLDFLFTGGVLTGQSTWASWEGAYQLDGFAQGSPNRSWWALYGAGCRESSMPVAAALLLDAKTYALEDPSPALRGKHVFRMDAVATTANAPVAHLISPFGKPTGIKHPAVWCEKVYLDLALPLFLLFTRADGWGLSSTGPLELRYDKTLVGRELWAQGAFADGSLHDLRVTKATRTAVPPLPRTFSRAALIGGATSASGVAASNLSPAANPILRYDL